MKFYRTVFFLLLIFPVISSCAKTSTSTATQQPIHNEIVQPTKTINAVAVKPINLYKTPSPATSIPLAGKTQEPNSTPESVEMPFGSLMIYDISHAKGMLINSIGLNVNQFQFNDIDWNNPAWSPDGHWIVFTFIFGSRPNGRPEIGISRLDGSGFRQITNSATPKFAPAWSPDEQNIAYIELVDGRWGDIVIVNSDGSNSRKLTYTPFDESWPAWSPDGTKMAFVYPDETKSNCRNCLFLMVIDKDGKNRRRVIDTYITDSKPAWSPDGTQLAFIPYVNEYICGQISLVALDGTNQSNVSNFPGCPVELTWSSDGQWIAFIGQNHPRANVTEQESGIYLLNLNDGSIVTVLEPINEYGLVYFEGLGWSPVPGLLIGETYEITNLGTNLNLRDSPSIHSNIKTNLVSGDKVIVLEGPVDVDEYYWWRMRTSDGLEGWAVEVQGWYRITK